VAVVVYHESSVDSSVQAEDAAFINKNVPDTLQRALKFISFTAHFIYHDEDLVEDT
jgi:hypothetical protein